MDSRHQKNTLHPYCQSVKCIQLLLPCSDHLYWWFGCGLSTCSWIQIRPWGFSMNFSWAFIMSPVGRYIEHPVYTIWLRVLPEFEFDVRGKIEFGFLPTYMAFLTPCNASRIILPKTGWVGSIWWYRSTHWLKKYFIFLE